MFWLSSRGTYSVLTGSCADRGDGLPLQLLVSIVDSISACHAEDRGSIPRRGELDLLLLPNDPCKNLFCSGKGSRTAVLTAA